MKNHFKKRWWIYMPVTLAGWLITIAYLFIAGYTLYRIEQGYNSFYHSLIRFFPYFISFSVIWFWIAGNSSGKKE